jgi:hypothetical protein
VKAILQYLNSAASGLFSFNNPTCRCRPVNKNAMQNQNTWKRKPCLSEHQKLIRFLTGLSVGICTLIAVVFFWLVNRPGFLSH